MAWTWEEIDRDWLLGGAIAVPPDQVVRAFETAERLLGRDWIEGHRLKPGVVMSGTAPTLAVVSIGQQLSVIEGRLGSQQLIERMQRGDRSASAELSAIFLCVTDHPEIEIELSADVDVSGRTRQSDFRLRSNGAECTYVEVAAPDISVAQQNAQGVMQRVGELISSVPVGTAIGLFLRREPTDDEIAMVVSEMSKLSGAGVAGVRDIGGLAIIAVNLSPPPELTLHDYGEPVTPRVGLARFESSGGVADRRVSVRYPFTDERAEAFLAKEARQLPPNAPGLIMLSMPRAPGGFKSWRCLLSRRLQPSLHTRVSGICLFQSGLEATPNGEAWVPHTSYIGNPHARQPIPPWLVSNLRRFEREEAA